jgi:hypothetical protein
MVDALRGMAMNRTAFGIVALAGLVGSAGCVADAEYVDSEDFGNERVVQDWNGTYALTWTCVGSKFSGCPVGATCDETACPSAPLERAESATIVGVGDVALPQIQYARENIVQYWSYAGTDEPNSLNARGMPTADGLNSVPQYVLWATPDGGFRGDISWIDRVPGYPDVAASVTVTWHVVGTRSSGSAHL